MNLTFTWGIRNLASRTFSFLSPLGGNCQTIYLKVIVLHVHAFWNQRERVSVLNRKFMEDSTESLTRVRKPSSSMGALIPEKGGPHN